MLERLGIFAAAPQAVLERLAAARDRAEFAAGAAIVREGEPADALYVILEGAVEVTGAGEAGEEQRLRTMGADTYFGEIGLLERIPRTATVTATAARAATGSTVTSSSTRSRRRLRRHRSSTAPARAWRPATRRAG